MNLDIRTFAFVLSFAFVIQAIALYLLSISIKRYNGMNFWAIGNLSIALGFIAMFFRNQYDFEWTLIIISNFFHFFGLTIIYEGSKKFLLQKRSDGIIWLLLFGFLLAIGYFTVFRDNVNARIILYSIFICIITFLNGWTYILKESQSIKSSALFIASLFFVLSAFMLFRSVYTIILNPYSDFYINNDLVQSLTFTISISNGLLWTFGLIIAVNQKLNSELVQKGNQLQQVFNAIPDAVFVSEINSGRLLSINKGFSMLTGYSFIEAENSSLDNLKIWKNGEDKMILAGETDNVNEVRNKTSFLTHKSGNEIPVLVSFTRFLYNNNDSVLAVVRDITELTLKEAEIELKNQELELLNLEKEKFFSIIAHDLRSPFASLISLSEVLMNRTYNFSVDQMCELASSIYKTTLSTNELLEDLLNWSGTRRGTRSFQPIEATFETMMQNTLTNMHYLAENKGITLNNTIAAHTIIKADPYMFQTIIRNLVGNSIKFTPSGGSVTLESVNEGKGQLHFKVTDNGIGMEPKMIDTLFRIDVKNNRMGTDGEPSSGLGLLLCKEFIEKHGGKIWAESQKGNGSRFNFTLPV
jgi:PAS domain S-box-containing protein